MREGLISIECAVLSLVDGAFESHVELTLARRPGPISAGPLTTTVAVHLLCATTIIRLDEAKTAMIEVAWCGGAC